MKDSRAEAFSNSRNIPVERKVSCQLNFPSFSWHFFFPSKKIQQLINTIVREELAQEIDNDIELHEIIMKEIFDHWEQWQNEEFERDMQGLIEAELQTQVFCPVCERNLLSLQENIISCGCGLRWISSYPFLIIQIIVLNIFSDFITRRLYQSFLKRFNWI